MAHCLCWIKLSLKEVYEVQFKHLGPTTDIASNIATNMARTISLSDNNTAAAEIVAAAAVYGAYVSKVSWVYVYFIRVMRACNSNNRSVRNNNIQRYTTDDDDGNTIWPVNDHSSQ